MDPRRALLKNFYYSTVKNKNVKIRCIDKLYFGGTDIQIVPEAAYSILKATNRLNNCLFIFQLDYTVNENNGPTDKSIQYAFKIVSEKEFNMYKDMENAARAKDIIRPKKVR